MGGLGAPIRREGGFVMMVIDRLRTVSGRDEVIAMVAVCAGVCGGMAVLPVPPVLRAFTLKTNWLP